MNNESIPSTEEESPTLDSRAKSNFRGPTNIRTQGTSKIVLQEQEHEFIRL